MSGKEMKWFITLLVFAIIISVAVQVIIGGDNLSKYNQERNIAINGCIQCKLQEVDRYYFYTCNGSEYKIDREDWVNLNASICD